MTIIQNNIHQLHKLIYSAAIQNGRDPKEITLLVVSKNRSVMAIQDAIETGQRHFGENYIHEGINKINWFHKNLKHIKLIWHFIGHVQSNKSRLVAEKFDWCQSIDRFKLIYRLNNQRPIDMIPLNVLIQINISNEKTKYGISPQEMIPIASVIHQCPRLCLRGLMAISILDDNFQHQLYFFKKINKLYNLLKSTYSNIDTLSIGMSNDMIAGIHAGSTMIRIGTAIFNINKIN